MRILVITLAFLFLTNLSTSFSSSPGDDLITKGKSETENPLTPSSSTKKVFTGGDIGASFGDYTEVRICPLIGYRISPYVSTGLKFIYIHSWQKINQNQVNPTTLQSNTLGGNVFLTYYPINTFYLKGEFEYDSYKNYATTQSTPATTNGVPFLYLGLGYNKPISKNVNFNAGIKVDVLNNQNSPYEDFTPIFDVGIGVGI